DFINSIVHFNFSISHKRITALRIATDNISRPIDEQREQTCSSNKLLNKLGLINILIEIEKRKMNSASLSIPFVSLIWISPSRSHSNGQEDSRGTGDLG